MLIHPVFRASRIPVRNGLITNYLLQTKKQLYSASKSIYVSWPPNFQILSSSLLEPSQSIPFFLLYIFQTKTISSISFLSLIFSQFYCSSNFQLNWGLVKFCSYVLWLVIWISMTVSMSLYKNGIFPLWAMLKSFRLLIPQQKIERPKWRKWEEVTLRYGKKDRCGPIVLTTDECTS